MGRRKLEMKRIEDKSSRLVTFSKRRGGLFKKARHLSALCQADIAVIVFSGRGRLHQCTSGGSSASQIISRYQSSCLGAESSTTPGAGQETSPSCTKFRTCKELLETVKRIDEPKAEELTRTDLIELEEELAAALVQARSRKNQLMIEHISTLHEKERKLTEENKQMEQEVACTNHIVSGVDNLATNQINAPQLVTLPLFTR